MVNQTFQPLKVLDSAACWKLLATGRPLMKHFKVETEGHVQTWTMSNPPMNYMTAAMSGIAQTNGRAEADENVRVIILTGGLRQIDRPLPCRRTGRRRRQIPPNARERSLC